MISLAHRPINITNSDTSRRVQHSVARLPLGWTKSTNSGATDAGASISLLVLIGTSFRLLKADKHMPSRDKHASDWDSKPRSTVGKTRISPIFQGETAPARGATNSHDWRNVGGTISLVVFEIGRHRLH